MGIQITCRCDKCNKVIEETVPGKTPNGFAILGNIYVASITANNNAIGGGLIGNNLDCELRGIELGRVARISYFCPDCLLEALYLASLYTLRNSHDEYFISR